MPSVDERFASALHSTARGWRSAVDRRLKGLGLSQAGWVAVAIIAKEKAPPSQTELANLVGVEAATMVATLDRLEKAGLVERLPSVTDRRVKRIALTPAGVQLYGRVRREADAVRKDLLSGVDRAQLQAATELLEALHGVAEMSS